MVEAARSPCALEYDLASGGRGDRDDLVSGCWPNWSPAVRPNIAATIVNNNAAAVLLTLNALAQGKEAVVSRGELVEIGGAFRVPDVMRRCAGQAGRDRHHQPHARQGLRRGDHGPKTALLMKVHTSNYAVVGFTKVVRKSGQDCPCREHGCLSSSTSAAAR
jgi:L-seryl-tRNA(Ser) seleniumtransferase